MQNKVSLKMQVLMFLSILQEYFNGDSFVIANKILKYAH